MRYIYSWEDNFKTYLNNLYSKTINNLSGNEKLTAKIINQVEEYIHYLLENNYNREMILNKLSKIAEINFIDNIYTLKDIPVIRPLIIYNHTLALNKDCQNKELQTKDDMLRYSLYLGLSNKIINLKGGSINDFNSMYDTISDNEFIKTSYIISNGWLYLENILSNKLATSAITSKLDYEINEPDIQKYNKLLTGITKDTDILKDAINGNLSEILINRYTEKHKEFELYGILYLMGLLNLEEEAEYGIRPLPELKLDGIEYKNVFKTIDAYLDNKESIHKDEDTKTRLKKLKIMHQI